MNKKMNKAQLIYKYRLVIIMVAVVAGFSIAVPNFLSITTLTNVLWSMATVGIMAAGAIYPILTGGIDLSVGTLAGLTSVLLAYCMVNLGMSMWAAIGCALLLGVIVGLVNGLLTAKFRIPAFITTMAMMKITKGVAMVWSGGKTIHLLVSDLFLKIATYKILSVPFPVYLMLFIMLVSFWLLSRSSFGRKIIAVGGNKTASELSGVHADRVTIAGYVFSSVCAVMAGVVIASMTQQGKATMAEGYEMTVITGIVLGGASMAGGKGSIVGTLFGVVLIGLISAGMTMLNAPSEWHNIVKGLIIVTAVALDSYITRSSFKVKRSKDAPAKATV